MAIVSYESAEAVGRITISRPKRRNALNHTALEELHSAVHRAASEEVRCVVVTGDEGHFCAGADLTELEDLAFTESLRAALDDLAGLSCPTIAAITGSCMGLGVQIALACDLRIATPDARFAVPVAKLGLMVDHWTIQRLALCAGHSTARWMLLTAEPIDAARAVEVGLVQRLVDLEGDRPVAEAMDAEAMDAEGVAAEDTAAPKVDTDDTQRAVLAEADRLAASIVALAPLALSGSKLGLDLLERPGDESDTGGTYRAAFEQAWASDDLVEGRRAFGERRSPVFRGE